MSEPAGESTPTWTPSALTALPGRATATQRRTDAAQKAAAPAPSASPEEVRQKAHEAGFAEGLAAGRAQAEAIAAEMTTLLGAMASPFRDMDAVLLRELLELTERIVVAVLGREMEQGVDLEPVLQEALAALGTAAVPVELVLNPRDALLCRGAGLFDNEQFTVIEDDALEQGGLQLRAGSSFVDASVAARLDTAIAAIRREAGLPELEHPPAPSPQGGEDTQV